MDNAKIERYKREINDLKRRQKLFLIFGIILLVVGLALIIVSSIFFGITLYNLVEATTEQEIVGSSLALVFSFGFGLTFGILLLIGGASLIVLRSTILRIKINHRYTAIEQEEFNQ